MYRKLLRNLAQKSDKKPIGYPLANNFVGCPFDSYSFKNDSRMRKIPFYKLSIIKLFSPKPNLRYNEEYYMAKRIRSFTSYPLFKP